MKKLLWIIFFALFSVSYALDFATELSSRSGGAISPEVVSALIGYLAGGIVWVITAIAKRAGRTSGVTTVMVSAGLSALGVGVGGYLWGLYGTGWDGALNAALAAVSALVTANGKYIANAQAAEKAIKEQVTGDPKAAPPASSPLGPQ